MSIKTVVILEHIWDDKPYPYNKDVSVLPYIDGVCRLNNYELFYGKYIEGNGFEAWLDRFKNILGDKKRRIILYLAGHGSARTLGGINLSHLLPKIWTAANNLNIEGVILGGCFVGQNIDDMKAWTTESSLIWMIGYKYAVDWLPSTMMDMNIIDTALSSDPRILTNRKKIEDMLKQATAIFNPNSTMALDKYDNMQSFTDTVTCVIQHRKQGAKPLVTKII